jgi:diguanylate cyclase (GGDEF)-like protein
MVSDSEQRRIRELEGLQAAGTRRDLQIDGLCDLARLVSGLPMAAIGFVGPTGLALRAVSGAIAVPDGGAVLADVARLGLRALESGQPFVETSGAELLAELAAGAVAAARVPPVDQAGDDHRDDRGAAPGLGHVVAVPLVLRPGLGVGVLVALSDRPGRLTPEAVVGLTQLARSVVDRLRLDRIRFERRRERAAKKARNAEIAAQRSEIVRQRVLLEQTSRMARVGGWEYDTATDVFTWSPEVYRIVEVPAAIRPSFPATLDFFVPADRDRVRGLFRRALECGAGFEYEATLETGLGRLRRVRCLCEPQSGRGGGVSGLVGTLQDISDRRAIEERILFLARHDTMTGLANRDVFQERLAAGLRDGVGGETGRLIGLAMVDLDQFKAINDTLGHQAGDVLLTEVGQRFVATVGGRGMVARFGGDEFAVVLDDIADANDLKAVGAALMRAAEEPVRYGDRAIPVSISVGMAIGRNGDSAEELLKNADIALYEAKGEGRNRAVMFEGAMRDLVEQRQAVLRDIRRALASGELVLWYQPKVSLADDGHAGFEALLRWCRSDGMVMTPAFFGIAFEDPLLGRVIGEAVIEQAAAQAGAWLRAGLDFDHVAVNVSTAQFLRGDLDARILGALARHGVPARHFMIEVTETVLLARDAPLIATALERLAAAGVHVALDDFGTGCASLTHLKDFPVDVLKIDRSFVGEADLDEHGVAIIHTILALARTLGLAVVAEGVETESQADLLRRGGCDFLQGYLFSRPVPAEIIEERWQAASNGVPVVL